MTTEHSDIIDPPLTARVSRSHRYKRTIDSGDKPQLLYEKAVEKNPMYLTARKRDAKQIQFVKDFAEGGLFHACKKSRGIKEKAIGLAEKVLPDKVKKGIRGALKIMGR